EWRATRRRASRVVPTASAATSSRGAARNSRKFRNEDTDKARQAVLDGSHGWEIRRQRVARHVRITGRIDCESEAGILISTSEVGGIDECTGRAQICDERVAGRATEGRLH